MMSRITPLLLIGLASASLFGCSAGCSVEPTLNDVMVKEAESHYTSHPPKRKFAPTHNKQLAGSRNGRKSRTNGGTGKHGFQNVSGFSPSLFKSLIGNSSLDPYAMMLSIINAPRYDAINAKFKG